MSNVNEIITTPQGDVVFYKQVADFLTSARRHAKRQMDSTIAITYFEVGRMIVEREQQGEKRARYGAKLIKGLSEYLTEHCGRGFSVTNLKSFRKFYLVYSPAIQQTMSAESEKGQTPSALSEKQQTLIRAFGADAQIGQMPSDLFKLDWSQYQILMRVENADARSFYEIESARQQWTFEQLQRQVGSSLYERLALSRDKDKVMKLASEGQTVNDPQDIFKKPYILEFTGLEEREKYSEDDLAMSLINNLQKFLLELGKGFLYEAKGKRFTYDEDSYYVDLVLYNRLLQCYVLIDLKTKKLKHQDLGQMQMYVNYYDRYVKQDFEKPTIGILLCPDKSDKMVEVTLPLDSNIYASEYSLYLPDKALLQQKLAQWVEEYEEEQALRELTAGGDAE